MPMVTSEFDIEPG